MAINNVTPKTLTRLAAVVGKALSDDDAVSELSADAVLALALVA